MTTNVIEKYNNSKTNAKEDYTIIKSNIIDTIEESYKVLFDQPISELSNAFCQYYLAENINTKEHFFAIVLEKHLGFGTEHLKLLEKASSTFLISPIATEICKLSKTNDERIVVIVEKYDHRRNLHTLIKAIGPLPYRDLVDKLIIPFMQLMNFCEKHSIFLGNINIENIIWIDEAEAFMLRECFIAPCNYYQKAYALSPELFDCIHQARVSESFQSDYYAFGMCIAYAATGIDTWEKYSEDDFKALRLSESTAKLLLDRLSVSEDLKNFIKGCTLENPIERWTTRSIADWLSGKTSKVVNTEIREAVSALVFNRKNYFNAKAVAHAMFNNWELAVQFLKDDKLLKWVQRAITKTKLVEEINKIYEQSGKIKDVAMLSDKEDQMFRILQSLDPHGPIRCKNIAITITSFGRLLIDAVVLHHKEHIELILKILRSRYWEYSATAGGKHELRIKMIASFEKCIALYNPSQKGFTIERLMYMFNPNLPCLSDAIEGDYITDVASLLNKLDSLCEKYNNKVNFIDPHIFAYICEKLSIRSEVNIKKLSPYPAICSDEHVNALSIFVIANQEFKNLKFKHLAQFIALKLIDLLNTQLHNKRFKSYMEVALKESSVKGDLSKLLNVFTNTHMIQTDRHGFIIATKEVTALSRKILLLSDTKKIKLMGTFLGQRATVLFSYCLLFIILVFVYFGKL